MVEASSVCNVGAAHVEPPLYASTQRKTPAPTGGAIRRRAAAAGATHTGACLCKEHDAHDGAGDALSSMISALGVPRL